MKFGFFTDTYFPQVSGVATSIQTLKRELESKGHQVYIFTTTDPNAHPFEEDVIRMPSVPFISFKDRRIVVRGMLYAYLVAKELELDLIHTHTEFGAGILGKMVGKKLGVPVIHTYHTMYEDYLHYIAKGKVLKPTHVKYFSRFFVNHTTGVICPSERVIDKLKEYGITSPMRIIPTGIDIEKFQNTTITAKDKKELRYKLGIQNEHMMLLSLSRISYEKNIQAIIQGFPQIISEFPHARLIIVGDGPYVTNLQKISSDLSMNEYIKFVGEVPNDEVAIYYQSADYFVSASTSETQGLTYTEAMAAGLPCIVEGNAYLNSLFDHESLGKTFEQDKDFSDTFINYVKAKNKTDKNILEKKLYSISSTHFGEVIFDFYKDMLCYYNQLTVEKKVTPIKRIKVKFTSQKK